MKQQLIDLIRDYADLCHEEECDLLRTICQIPSPTRHEEKRADFIEHWLRQEGIPYVERDALHNVCCLLGNPSAPKLLLFSAHTDVVFPDTDALPLEERDSRLYCPGIGDDTANLTGLLMATRFLAARPELLPEDKGVLVAFDSCEEGLGNLDGIKAIFERYGDRISEHVSFDLYLPQVISCAVGSVRTEVEVRTQGGHSWHDFGRPSAIERLCAIVCDLHATELPLGTTINVGRIEGGTSVNAIASQARAVVEFRSRREDELAACKTLLESCALRHTSEEVDVRLRTLGTRPGTGPVDEEALEAMTQRNADIVSSVLGCAPDITCASTDANIALSRGIRANTIGAVSGALLHTRDEWVDPESLRPGLEVILRVMCASWQEA